MVATGNIKMAYESVLANKWRSFLTMLGIIIGIVAVVTTVGIGQGIKQQVADQINHLGRDLITIRPGRLPGSAMNPSLISLGGLYSNTGVSTISERDVIDIQRNKLVHYAVPFSLIASQVKSQGKTLPDSMVIATGYDLPQVLNQKVQYGSFFEADDTSDQSVVIGQDVAAKLFGERAPIGMTLNIQGQSFIVRGVFDKFDTNPLNPSADFNSAVFIPLSAGQQITNDNASIYQVLVKPFDVNKTDAAIGAIDSMLIKSHAGQKDFSILKQGQSLAIANGVLNLMTRLIAGVAAISLLVGGIGIMNIMLVSVTERTSEIGIRKAVGATNGQILKQFLTEAMVLSAIGGVLGVVFSILVAFLLAIFTNFAPVLTWPVVVVAVAVSMAVGIVFGVAPALKAARQDPIEALRHQ